MTNVIGFHGFAMRCRSMKRRDHCNETPRCSLRVSLASRTSGVVTLRARAAAADVTTLLGSLMLSPIEGVAIAASSFVVATSLHAACCTTLCPSARSHCFEIDGSIARKIARSEVQGSQASSGLHPLRCSHLGRCWSKCCRIEHYPCTNRFREWHLLHDSSLRFTRA